MVVDIITLCISINLFHLFFKDFVDYPLVFRQNILKEEQDESNDIERLKIMTEKVNRLLFTVKLQYAFIF